MLFSKIIKKKFDAVLGRYDGDPAQRYPVLSDFPELSSQPYDIPGDRKILLKGAFYYVGQLQPEKLIVFDHGIGAGHLAYLNEIACLARKGYTVYAYDHTGCASTGGTGILGFAQGINDQDHVLTALQQDARFRAVPRKVMGHSWGGYACMNVSALHPEVTHVVSLAGFLSARSLVEQYIPKAFLKYSGEVMERERQHNPSYADMDARESLQKSKAHLLHLQSRDDIKVKFERCCQPLSEALAGRPNTSLVVVDRKNHDPQRTEAAAAANAAMLRDLERERKKHRLNTPEQLEAFRASHDWDRITEQDPAIWEKIFAFLEEA